MEQKTVFISYRRDKSRHLARSIYMDLKMHGWDVFLDLENINAGDFDRIILNQIAARAHFILLLSPGSLERCTNPDDWVLREIEEAIRLKRNIVPIYETNVNLTHEMGYLPQDIRNVVSKKNALPLLDFFFDDAMTKLRERFLQTPEYVHIQETPTEDQPEVQRRIAAVEREIPAQTSTPSVAEQTTYDVLLIDPGPMPINVIKIVRDFTGLGLAETKNLVESAPAAVLQFFSKEVAEDIQTQLKAIGAVVEIKNILKPKVTMDGPVHLSSIELMPAPFDWIDIPSGRVQLIPDEIDKEKSYLTSSTWTTIDAFSITKYPITNAQFSEFMKAGGYQNHQWWTGVGWQQREEHSWTEPSYWQDGRWNNPTQPVVGVSWYEAIAFCLWLSETTREQIMLPTEAQWQYAAQGEDNRNFPWGNEWDSDNCNNSASFFKNDMTTPVTQYQGKGDSPFGIVDMAGNIWEWCLTDYENGINNFNNNADTYILHGGSWHDDAISNFYCTTRDGGDPPNRGNLRGFRIART